MYTDIMEFDEDDEDSEEDYIGEDFDSLDYDSTIEKVNDVLVLKEVLLFLETNQADVYSVFVESVGQDLGLKLN